MNNKDEFSTLDITRALGLPTQRFRMWIDEGYTPPSIQRASGQGTKNLFSRLDVYGIGLFRLLVEELKVSRELASKYVKDFVKMGDAEKAEYILFRVIDGKVSANALKAGVAKHCKVDVETSGLIWAPFGTEVALPETPDLPPQPPGKDYDYAILINFKKIREKVDARL